MTPPLAGHHQDSISNPPELSDSKEALWGTLQQNVYFTKSAQDHCTVISCHLDAMHSCGRREQCARNAGALLVQPMAQTLVLDIHCEVLSVEVLQQPKTMQVIDGFSFYRTPTRGVVQPFHELDHRSGD